MAEDSGEIVREVTEGGIAADVGVKLNGPAFLQNLSYANAVSLQQAMNLETLRQSGLNATAYAKAMDRILNTDPEEGITPTSIAEILAKVGGNVPPVTP